jgi:hypothetical protein
MIPLRCFALYWRGVKCCGFEEFWRELGEKTQKKWKFAKKISRKCKVFFIIYRFPFPDVLVASFAMTMIHRPSPIQFLCPTSLLPLQCQIVSIGHKP